MKKLFLILGSVLGLLCSGSGFSADFYSLHAKSIEQKDIDFSQYKGKTVLLVNTASQCGFTPQYAGLEKLAKAYQDRGFILLGFPSNDFGGQEPGNDTEIKLFCQKNYKVDFPLFTKLPVKGKEIQPVFSWLLANAPTHEDVGWNFEKFLVDRKGNLVSRFKSKVKPESDELNLAIEAALKK